MAITLASPIVSPSVTGYDVTQVSFDLSSSPKIVTISYAAIGGSGGGSVQMTLAQYDTYATGAGFRIRATNALASPAGLNLTGATVA